MKRKIDNLGRIVIPVSIRKELSLYDGASLFAELRNGSIILTPESACCRLCGGGILSGSKIPICKSCEKEIKQL